MGSPCRSTVNGRCPTRARGAQVAAQQLGAVPGARLAFEFVDQFPWAARR